MELCIFSTLKPTLLETPEVSTTKLYRQDNIFIISKAGVRSLNNNISIPNFKQACKTKTKKTQHVN